MFKSSMCERTASRSDPPSATRWVWATSTASERLPRHAMVTSSCATARTSMTSSLWIWIPCCQLRCTPTSLSSSTEVKDSNKQSCTCRSKLLFYANSFQTFSRAASKRSSTCSNKTQPLLLWASFRRSTSQK